MYSTSRAATHFAFILVSVMLFVIVSFILFEQSSTEWITQNVENLSQTGSGFLIALFIALVIGTDVVLPIPSSIVSVFAASTLGFTFGAVTIWVGLMISCLLGYMIGAGSKQFLLSKQISEQDMQKAESLSSKLGAGVLITMRGVPVLAETSVIAAGLVRYPIVKFWLLTGLSNAGLALAYAYIGATGQEQDSFLLIVAGTIAIPALAWLINAGVSRERRVERDQQSIDVPIIDEINAQFKMQHQYPIYFRKRVFTQETQWLAEVLTKKQVMVYIDQGIVNARPIFIQQVQQFFDRYASTVHLLCPPKLLPGGESVKDAIYIQQLYQDMLDAGIDRHCCIIAIGGGAVLDVVGFACATFHRGVQLIRMPSTVLAQNDAGVGVKNGYNLYDAKNLIGTFVPPRVVINDVDLLNYLSVRDRRSGLAEAVKVAAIRDKAFFGWMESNVESLRHFDEQKSEYCIARCAQLHVNQITQAGDPFEYGSARPLDFGHWAAHKLEVLSGYQLRHGEAVAIGMALDTHYAVNAGLLSVEKAKRLMQLLIGLGFSLWHPALLFGKETGQWHLLDGIEEFRQHLGGQLCITLLSDIGKGQEVNEIDIEQMKTAIVALSRYAAS